MTAPLTTEHDVQAFAEKLEAFGDTLSAGERGALAALVELAARGAQDGPSEVTGHMYGDLMNALVAEARHREDLATADRARLVAEARAARPQSESVWDRLRRRVPQPGGQQPAPRLQPATEPVGGA